VKPAVEPAFLGTLSRAPGITAQNDPQVGLEWEKSDTRAEDGSYYDSRGPAPKWWQRLG
jgi:hypothetical protein